MMERKLIAAGGILDYDPEFLSKEESDKLYQSLTANVQWEQKKYKDRKTGVEYPQPRLTAWYADHESLAYSYSGVTQLVQAWLPELLELKEKIEKITGATYNSVLLNYYRDGKDSVGLHADDEKELGTNANIASVSLGTTRKFQLTQTKKSPDKTEPFPGYEEYNLTSGSLLVMSGTTQHYWKHAIPKDFDVEGGRINLTYRFIAVHHSLK
jgi:alkylated DNA repair dioxygenase AlkB